MFFAHTLLSDHCSSAEKTYSYVEHGVSSQPLVFLSSHSCFTAIQEKNDGLPSVWQFFMQSGSNEIEISSLTFVFSWVEEAVE